VTILVAQLCSNGAVLGADQLTSFKEGTFHVGQALTHKIHILNEGWAALACAGDVGCAQLAVKQLSEFVQVGPKSKGLDEPGLSAAIKGLLAKTPCSIAESLKAIQLVPGNNHLIEMYRHLLGSGIYMQGIGPENHKRAAALQYRGAHEATYLDAEKMAFATVGSGSLLADPYMIILRDLLFPSRLPTLDEGMLAVYWTLDSVIKTNAGGGVGGKPELALLRPNNKGNFRAILADDSIMEPLRRSHEGLSADIREAFERVTGEATEEEIMPPTAEDA